MAVATQIGRRAERGYVLLTLILFTAVLAILSLAWIQKVDFEIKRDREQELIHRGVQYSRAVRRFFKKFGRYPARIEELEQTNHVRFLRKRYKDPITGKDFKPLYMTDVQTSFSPGAASGLPPGTPGSNPAALQPGAAPPGFPANMPGPATANANLSAPSGDTGQAPEQSAGNIPGQPDQSATNNAGSATPSATPQPPASAPGSGQTTAGKSGDNRVFGGGPIVGVVSTSKEKSIRVFNKKDHYNQWQFIYDPATDRGGLLMTPNQPPLQGAANNNGQQNPQPGANPQGQNPSFGPTQGAGPGSPQPPQSPPEQQPPPQ